MTRLSLRERVGEALVGRLPGMRLREEVEHAARDGQTIVLDFAGVVLVSPSFADEVFAKLDPALVEAGTVRFENLDDELAALVALVRRARAAAG